MFMALEASGSILFMASPMAIELSIVAGGGSCGCLISFIAQYIEEWLPFVRKKSAVSLT